MHLPPIDFGLEIPLFPLPNCVLFPGVVQPLHIFEPRYRELMRAVVGEGGNGQMAIAMALLKSGWEKDYYGSPEIHAMACVGRVIAHELLEDGKYNLLVQGVSRAQVISERKVEQGYRVAILQPVPETSDTGENLQKQAFKELFERTALKNLTVTPALWSLFDEGVPMGRLVDALAFALVQDVDMKQKILEATDSAARGELLARELVGLAERLGGMTEGNWPPSLGMN